MRLFINKLSLISCMSLATFFFLTSNSPLYADEISNLVTDISPTADCTEKEQVIPTCIFSRPTPATPLDLISGDLKVCKCLEKNNSLMAPYEVHPSTLTKTQSEQNRLIEIERKKAANQGVVQSINYAKDKNDVDTALIVYGGQETRQKIKSSVREEGSKVKISRVPPPVISENVTKLNLISDKNKDWQCVTYQEYSVQRELPNDNAFFQVLKKAEFSSADWNVNQLKAKFDTASAQEKDSIRIKLTFLSRNPIFQSIMKAEPSERNTAAKILEKQNQLFGILRTLSPSEASNCFSIPNGCFQEVHTSGAFSTYTNKVGEFILDKDVIDIASAQAATDYVNELEKISEQGQLVLNSIPTDPDGYFNYLQNANRELVTSCAGKTAQAACYTKFSAHCTHLKAVDERVKRGIQLTSQDIVSGLREETSLHLNLDPELNPNFRTFNDQICLQPHKNSNGISLNFFQYKEQKCRGAGSQLPECSDRKALLQRFLGEHNGSDNLADVNLRSGFSQLLGDTKFLDVSLAQVEAANNISESPAELRARFGGEFPSISPEGKLIPFVTSNINSRTASTSSSSSASFDNDLIDNNQAGSTSASSFVPASSSSADTREISSSANNAVRSRESYGSTSNIIPDSLKLPELPAKGNNLPYIPSVRRLPASVAESTVGDDSDETTPFNQATPQTKPTTSVKGSSGGGSGSTVVSASGSTAVSGSGDGPSGAGQSEAYTRAVNSKKKSGKGLLFKYGLDENNQPEISLVNPTSSEVVKVGVDKNLMERIKSNPNALEMGQADLDKIMATPDAEVKLVIEASNGAESLVVYARKDDTGGISFSLKQSRLPASVKKPIRVNVLPEVYGNIASDPDVYLNQNEALMNEIVSKPGSPPTLQIVSPGKKALIYDVIKTDEFIYHFKLKNK